jgi:hypothetical protein
MPVRRYRAQYAVTIVSPIRRVDINAIQVVARFLGGYGEAGAIDQLAQILGRQAEGMRQVTTGQRWKIFRW